MNEWTQTLETLIRILDSAPKSLLVGIIIGFAMAWCLYLKMTK